jgi:pyridoxine 5-phosphate synthase
MILDTIIFKSIVNDIDTMTHLSVNLNRVALLRNSRNIGIPSVVDAARTVLKAGAYGITVHPRPDQRHIKPEDVYELAEFLKAEFPTAEYNIEGNPFEAQFMDLVCAVKPNQCTLVPDAADAFTSDHGWDLPADQERLTPIIQQLKHQGIRVSLFMDANPEPMAQIESSFTPNPTPLLFETVGLMPSGQTTRSPLRPLKPLVWA